MAESLKLSLPRSNESPSNRQGARRESGAFLKEKMRMTRQRRIILEELVASNAHPSADEVYEMVRKRMPRISLGTVYRNLEVLSELGEIQKLEHCGTQKRFDGNPENHYHIRCMKCDRVDDAPVDVIENLDERLCSETGYQVIGHRLEFIGLCAQCAQHMAVTENQKSLLL